MHTRVDLSALCFAGRRQCRPWAPFMAAGCDAGACHLDLPAAAAASAPRAGRFSSRARPSINKTRRFSFKDERTHGR